ncbi:MAG: TonB-dependent receptor domain-containing protein, partial [Bryobacteraceae bacterium]
SQEGSVSAGYDITEQWKVSLRGRAGQFYVEDPGPVFAPLAGSYARVVRGGGSLAFDDQLPHAWGSFVVFSNHGHHILTDGFRSVDRTTGLRVSQSVAPKPRLVLEAGAEALNYGGRARNVLRSLDYGSHSLTSAAGFGRANWVPGWKMRLSAGARYESNSVFGSILAPEVGVGLQLRPGHDLALSVARGFRNPTIRELYLFPAPNPQLRREQLWNYEASWKARLPANLESQFTAFYADAKNLIISTGYFPNLRLQNSGAVIHRGFEQSLRCRPRRNLKISAGWMRLWSGNLPAYTPATRGIYAADFTLGRAFVHLSGVCTGRTWVDARHTRQLGGYHVATLKLDVPVRAHWNAFLLVDNLFDKRYQVIEGYPLPGVNTAAGVTLSF